MPLSLFRVRNFAVGNLTTLAIYAGPRRVHLLHRGLRPAGRRLHADRGRPLAAPAHVADLPRCRRASARSPTARAAPLHVGRPDARRRRPAPVAAGQRTRELLHRSVLPGVLVFGFGLPPTVAPLTATVLGSVEPGPLGSGQRRQQRRRAGRRPARDRRGRRGGVGGLPARLELDVAHLPLSPQAQAAVASLRNDRTSATLSHLPAPERPSPPGARRRLRPRVPRRDRDRGGARAPRRGSVAGGDPESPSPGCLAATVPSAHSDQPRGGVDSGRRAARRRRARPGRVEQLGCRPLSEPEPFVALVTGASSGIGEATARRLAREPGARARARRAPA